MLSLVWDFLVYPIWNHRRILFLGAMMQKVGESADPGGRQLKELVL